MILNEKERSVIEDLQTQEKSCVEKYARYAGQAMDQELQNLFGRLQKEEQEHYDSLGQVLSGTVHRVTATTMQGGNISQRRRILR